MSDPRFNGLSTNLPPFPAAPSTKPPVTPNLDSNGNPIGTATGGFPAFFQFDRNTKNPYSILLNFGIQRELPGNLLLEATYVNRMGRRLLAVGDAATITNFKDTASGTFLRPAFGQLQQELPGFIAQVNAGNPNPSVAPIPWFENQMNCQIAANFGPGFDCTSFGVANCSTLIEISSGSSSIITWRTGYPFTIHTNSFPTAFTLDAPAVLLNAAGLKPGIHTDLGGILQYFASQSSAIAAMGYPFAGGTGTRNAARGPGFFSVDMGIWKAIKLPRSEHQQLKLRLDTFNTFNHPVFNGPSSATLANTGQFGIITSTASAPRVLQVSLRYEF